MTYTLATHLPTHNYTLLHTRLSNHLHTFTHHPLGVCKVCKCVVWDLCVAGKKMLFRIGVNQHINLVELLMTDAPPAWRAQQCQN